MSYVNVKRHVCAERVRIRNSDRMQDVFVDRLAENLNETLFLDAVSSSKIFIILSLMIWSWLLTTRLHTNIYSIIYLDSISIESSL